jgi:hypothetical protein
MYLSADISWFGRSVSWKFLYRCKITGKVLESFGGLWFESHFSLSVKGKNLYVSSSCFLIMTSPKPSVNRNFIVDKYNQDVGI